MAPGRTTLAFGCFLCFDHDHVAGALASVSATVPFGRSEALKRRLNLAQPHSAEIPLLDPAPAHTRSLVCRPAAHVVPEGFRRGSLHAGTRNPVSDFYSAKV